MQYLDIRMQYLLEQTGTLKIGASTFDDAHKIALRVNAIPSEVCTSNDCGWYVHIDNSILPGLWRGPVTDFLVSFQVKDSIVINRIYRYRIGNGMNSSSIEINEHADSRGCLEPICISRQTKENNPYYRTSVFMTPAVSMEYRKRYLSFNMNCMWKFRGCKNALDLLPTIN